MQAKSPEGDVLKGNLKYLKWMVSLTSLNIIPSMSIHIVPRAHSFLWLRNIPHSLYIFLIHSSLDGLSGYFHILAIVNNAAVNIDALISFRTGAFLFSLGKHPVEEFLDHVATLIF